jgi:glycosyltransferase involved in cell wall biosynthesis
VPDRPTSTPRSWRAASLGTLVGGVAVGAAAASGGGARILVAGSIGIVIAGLVPIVRASRRPPLGPDPVPPPGRELPTVSVVVAARDEATVLPRLIGDLAAQDHRHADGTPAFEVVVVDDRSVDGTADAVAAAAEATGLGEIVRVIPRTGEGLPDGKGAALSAAQPESCRGDVVTVLDADARVGPTFVRQVATYVACGVPALTPRRRIIAARSSNLAGAQADEQTQDGELQRGRWASGGCSEFRGNGISVRRDLLAAVGGWRPSALTEDLDLSSRLAARFGVTVAWAIDVEVWEEPVRTWPDLWRQRIRWSEGALRRFLEHGRAVVASPRLPLRARLDFAAYGVQLASPPLIIGAAAGAVATGAPGTAVALVGTYLAAGGVLAFDALRWETGPDGRPPGPVERVARSVRSAAFSVVWLGAVPVAMWRLGMRRGSVRYDKMPHLGDALTGEGDRS